MEQAAKEQEEQARNKEIEQEREQIENDKLSKQQMTQNGKTVIYNMCEHTRTCSVMIINELIYYIL